MPTTLILVRHGETVYNKIERIQGQIKDIPLSDEGIRQAEALSGRLKDEPIEAIYSSDLLRAEATAKIINKYHQVKIYLWKSLRERNFGAWEGKLLKELKAKYPQRFELLIEEPHKFKPPGKTGETLEQLISRVRRALNLLLSKNSEKKVLIVAHSGSIKALIIAAMKLPKESFRRIKIATGSISTLIFEENKGSHPNHNLPILQALNDTCHLE